MPFIEPTASSGIKRKRTNGKDDVPRKQSNATSVQRPAVNQAEIERLENEIKQSRKKYNNIAVLIEHAFPDSSKRCNDAAVLALCRTFSRILAEGSLQRKDGITNAEAAVLDWLKKRYDEFLLLLVSVITQEKYVSSLDILHLCMRIVRQEVSCNGVNQWTDALFAHLLGSLLRSSPARTSFVAGYFRFDDVRYYTVSLLPAATKNASGIAVSAIVEAALELLFAFPGPPSSNLDPDAMFVDQNNRATPLTRKSYMRKVQDAWLSIFELHMSKRQRKMVLGLLVHQIVPWFSQPERFMDFLTDSYNEGGETTLLALSGLFHLMQERNLDYPSFFTKLYSLLDNDLLQSKHRSRFFRLLDVFMASTHLPAALVASFIKRLSRLALQAPPSGIVVIVPWVYNMFQRHPSTTFMMHRSARYTEESQEWEAYGAEDSFDMMEPDPMLTGAIDSSVWEIQSLQSHYHPNVATLARIISEQFTKQQYNLEDFLDHSYDSLLQLELEKPLKKSAVVEYVIPQTILQKKDEDPSSLGAIYSRLSNL